MIYADTLTPLLESMGLTESESNQQARREIAEQGLRFWMRQQHHAQVQLLLRWWALPAPRVSRPLVDAAPAGTADHGVRD